MKFLQSKKYTILANIARYSFVFVFMCALAMPFVVINAATTPATVDNRTTATPATVDNRKTESSNVRVDTKINNPLGDNIRDIPTFIQALLKIVILVGIPIVTLAIIYSGFMFVQAQGNVEKLGTAKKNFVYTLIGAALLLGAFVISRAIQGTVDQIIRENK
ncbi:MAG: hypothetical protein KBB75_00875 [Candidatus Pacebacteria bacterium]|jgi:hypothetical protein|nr:hypothetical protein [Candidatus Paceibacterota bacterium]